MKSIAALITLLAILLPFQFALQPAEGVDLAIVRIIVPMVTLAWLFVRLGQRQVRLPATGQAALFFSFLFISALSLFVALQIGWGLRKLAFLFSLAPLYVVAWDIFASLPQWRTRIVKALLWGAGIAACVGVAQFSLQFFIGSGAVVERWHSLMVFFLGSSFAQTVSAHPSFFVHVSGHDLLRASAFFPDPHMMAFYMGMLLPFAVAFSAASSSGIKKISYGILAALLLLADILTFSRGGYAGLLGGAMIAAVLLRDRFFMRDARRTFIVLSLVTLFLVVFFSSPFGARMISIFDVTEGSNQGRIATWMQALTIIAHHPIGGVGIGNYAIVVDPSADYRAPYYAHNLYLDIAAESGVSAALLWIGMLTTAFFSFVRAGKRDSVAIACAVSIVIFSVHALFETPLYSVHVFPILLLILSLGAAYASPSRHSVAQ
ncbi:MAG TPA: O-antigen ligase family protein [Patescibacteria group bacterium]|nr:O-antigen ligase family protein [Patescibacteria group bacterium]